MVFLPSHVSLGVLLPLSPDYEHMWRPGHEERWVVVANAADSLCALGHAEHGPPCSGGVHLSRLDHHFSPHEDDFPPTGADVQRNLIHEVVVDKF